MVIFQLEVLYKYISKEIRLLFIYVYAALTAKKRGDSFWTSMSLFRFVDMTELYLI